MARAAKKRTAATSRAPRERAARRAGTAVIPGLSLWDQFQRVGGGLTPSEVSSIIREADTGNMRRLIDLANESRQKDGHLHGCLEQAEQSISAIDWELSLPPNPKPSEKKAAAWIEARLRENDGFFRLIAHLAGAVYYSFAVAEIIWTKTSDGKVAPGCFELLDARRFGFRQEDGCFVWKDTGKPEIDFRKDYPGKFVTSQPRVTGDVPCREGLARLLVWAALFRNWTMSDWLRLGEIAWKPWRIGTYKKGASKEDIEGLLEVLEGMSANGAAKVPETVSIDVKWAPNATTKSTHEGLFETVAREMSKAILGQTETISSSQSSGYAQAKVHKEVRKDLREARAKQIGVDLTRDVVHPMFAMNFGGRLRPPSLVFITQDPVDFKAFAEGVKTLKDAGTRITQAWVREEAGIPEPKAGEELLGENVPAAEPADDAGDGAIGDSNDEEDGNAPKPADDAEQPDAAEE